MDRDTDLKATLIFRLPSDLDRQLRRLADRKGKTVSEQLRELAREAVSHERREATA